MNIFKQIATALEFFKQKKKENVFCYFMADATIGKKRGNQHDLVLFSCVLAIR